MGVKDLWSIVSSVGERKPLWELKDKTVAVDLSCWVVSDNLCAADRAVQPRMYLRNLFFRTTCLLLLGTHPVFVLEGVAPELKHDTIAKRRNVNCGQKGPAKPSGRRSRLNSSLKQCQKLLNIMGLSCVQSPGEAEAFCALLNQRGLVDGCITQDGDAFLYGAETVYRNLTISPSGGSSGSNAGFSVDVFKMHIIQEKLSLKRNDLIAISLLCGCDYSEKGISGVGKEMVLKFLSGVNNEDVLSRLKRWRTDRSFDELDKQKSDISKGKVCAICGHNGKKLKHEKSGCPDCGLTKGCSQNASMLVLSDPAVVAELSIRKRALLDPDFPSEAVLTEFLQQESDIDAVDRTWKKPDLRAFIKFSVQFLAWTEVYAIEKFLPLVTRWQIQNCMKSPPDCVFVPKFIIKKRVLKGVESYEVQWSDPLNVLSGIKYDEANLVTIEPRFLMERTHPSLVDAFISATKKPAKKGSKAKKKECPGKENSVVSAGTQTKLDHFFKERRKISMQNLETVFGKSNTQAGCRTIKESKSNTQASCGAMKESKSNTQASCGAIEESNTLNNRTKEHIRCIYTSFCESFSALKISNNCTDSMQSPRFCSETSHKSENSNSSGVCNCDISVCWESCSLCQDDDSQVDFNLSDIIDGIVNKNFTKDVIGVSEKKEERETTVLQTGDLDQFDLLACGESYVPLEARIKATKEGSPTL